MTGRRIDGTAASFQTSRATNAFAEDIQSVRGGGFSDAGLLGDHWTLCWYRCELRSMGCALMRFQRRCWVLGIGKLFSQSPIPNTQYLIPILGIALKSTATNDERPTTEARCWSFVVGTFVESLHAQVRFLDDLILAQALRRIGQHDLPSLEHIAAMRDSQCHQRVLLDQQNGGA
jgi:hypothetical protein